MGNNRSGIAHPALNTAGGSALWTSIDNIYQLLSDQDLGRWVEFSALANSAKVTVTHNFGVSFDDLKVVVYTGTYPNLTQVQTFTVAATAGSEKTKVDVTAPASGGPFSGYVLVIHDVACKQRVVTTAQRLAIASPYVSMLVYDSDLKSLMVWNGTTWTPAGGGATLKSTITAAAHGFLTADIGSPLYLNGSVYTKATSNAANTSELVGMLESIIDANTFSLAMAGEVSIHTSVSGGALVPGECYFLSPNDAGKITNTEPSVVGHISKPLGVAKSTSVLHFINMRGSVVGSSNARTQIALSGGLSGGPFTTTVQNIADYDAGELTGWISITATTPLRFYVAAQFSKNGAANNYNVSYQVSGDTPPALFSMTVTAGGLLQITLPSVTGFASASINYALNAPAIGTSFPLSVDSSSVQFQKIVPKDTSGISVRNAADSLTNVFVSDAGNVGIGTTIPGENLHIRTSSPRIRIEDIDNAGAYSQISGGLAGGSISIAADVTNAAASSEIQFSVDGTTRMSISSSGNIFIGPSEFGPVGTLELNAGGSGDRNTYIDFHSHGSPGANDFSTRVIRSPGVSGVFDIINVTNGVRLTANGNAWSALSDARHKKNVKDLEYGLDQVKAMRPVRFDYDVDESEESKRLGFVAQELMTLVKESVHGSEEEEYSVSATDLIPVMIKAIQELKAEIDAAKTEIAALKGV